MKKARESLINIVNYPSGVIQSTVIILPVVLVMGVCVLMMASLEPQEVHAMAPVAHQDRPGAADSEPQHNAHRSPHATAVSATRAITTPHTDIDGPVHPMTDIIIINVPPRTRDANLTTSEDTALDGVLEATDGNDNDVLTYRIIEPPENGTVVITDPTGGTFVYTPTRDFYGTDRFTFRANDGRVDSRSDGTVTITVAPVNDAPRFMSTPLLTATAKMSYTYTIDSVDADDEPVTITAPDIPAWLNLADNGDGTAVLTGTPDAADVGEHPIVLRVTDSSGERSTQRFTLTVLPPDEANLRVSIASSATQIIDNQSITYTVTVTNTGPAVARAVSATVTLTDGIALVSAVDTGEPLSQSRDGWQCAVTVHNHEKICTRPMLEVGAVSTITVTARAVDGPGVATVTASATAANYPVDAAMASDDLSVDVLMTVYLPGLFSPFQNVPLLLPDTRHLTGAKQERQLNFPGHTGRESSELVP